jgi:hypothetical protein
MLTPVASFAATGPLGCRPETGPAIARLHEFDVDLVGLAANNSEELFDWDGTA